MRWHYYNILKLSTTQLDESREKKHTFIKHTQIANRSFYPHIHIPTAPLPSLTPSTYLYSFISIYLAIYLSVSVNIQLAYEYMQIRMNECIKFFLTFFYNSLLCSPLSLSLPPLLPLALHSPPCLPAYLPHTTTFLYQPEQNNMCNEYQTRATGSLLHKWQEKAAREEQTLPTSSSEFRELPLLRLVFPLTSRGIEWCPSIHRRVDVNELDSSTFILWRIDQD